MSSSSCAKFASLCAAWVGFVVVPGLLAQEATPRLGEKEAVIEAALSEPGDLDFDEQPLQDVVEFLKQKHEIQIQVDTKALADAGVGSDTVVTRHVHDVKLSSALDLLLDDLELTYLIRDEVLLLTTKAEAENMLMTRVYPVADLIAPRDDDLVVGVGSEFTGLIELITSTVDPTTWDEVGGPGSIKEHRKSLVISQTYAVHRNIVDLLKSLRAVDRETESGDDKPRHAANDDGQMQLKVYRLPAKWQLGNVAPPAQAPARQPAAPTPATPAPAAPAAPAGTPVAPEPAKTPAAETFQYGSGAPATDADTQKARLRELVELIESVIEPDSWSDGGGQGVIRAINGTLVVRQTPDVHRQILRLLGAL